MFEIVQGDGFAKLANNRWSILCLAVDWLSNCQQEILVMKLIASQPPFL
jgi:hypothetical protein